jgi:hypothetical protein
MTPAGIARKLRQSHGFDIATRKVSARILDARTKLVASKSAERDGYLWGRVMLWSLVLSNIARNRGE